MKRITLILLTVLLASTTIFAQESTDTTETKEKRVQFNVTGTVTLANVNEAGRVGKAIGPYGLNIAPLVQLNMRTRRTNGWYVWVYKPFTPTHIDQSGNYLQFQLGKQVKIGDYVVLNPHVSYFIPQHQYFLKYEQTSWIFTVIMAAHVSKKSATNPNETHMVDVFITRFENPSGIGSEWNFRLGWKKSIKYVTVATKFWYNNGLFGTDSGFNGGLSVMTNKYKVGKRVYIQGTATGFVNITRNTNNPFTTDAGVIGLIVGYK